MCLLSCNKILLEDQGDRERGGFIFLLFIFLTKYRFSHEWCYSAAALQVVLQCCRSAGGVRVEATQLCTGRGLMLLTINGSLLSTRLMLNTVPDHLTASPGNRFSPALCYTCWDLPQLPGGEGLKGIEEVSQGFMNMTQLNQEGQQFWLEASSSIQF